MKSKRFITLVAIFVISLLAGAAAFGDLQLAREQHRIESGDPFGELFADEKLRLALVPLADFTWDVNLRTSSGAIRASFFIPIICFVAMFLYAVGFGPNKKEELV